MKTILVLLILLSAIAMPAVAALTDADLNKIRLIVKEEIKEELKPIKAEIASIKTEIGSIKTDIGTLKEGVARLDGRMDGVEKQVAHATNLTYGLIALIVAAIGIPAWARKTGSRPGAKNRRTQAGNRNTQTTENCQSMTNTNGMSLGIVKN